MKSKNRFSIYWRWIILLCSPFSFSSLAQDMRGATLQEVSFSGRSFIINRGHFHGLKSDSPMEAKFLWQRSETELLPLGRAKLIKLHHDRSYWIFQTLRQDLVLEPGVELLYTPIAEISRGLSPLRVRQVNKVYNQGMHSLRDIIGEDFFEQDVLVRLESDAEKIYLENSQTKQNREHLDFQLSKLDEFYLSRSLSFLLDYRDALQRKRQTSAQTFDEHHDFLKFQENEIYRSVIQTFIEHSDVITRSELERYRRVQGPRDSRFNTGIHVENTFERHQRRQEQLRERNHEVIDMVQRDHPLWSAHMSESELRHFFVHSGYEEERRRQKLALNQNAAHQIRLDFKTGLYENSINSELDLAGQARSLGIFYDFHAIRISPILRRWSLYGGVEWEKSFHSIGEFNAEYDMTYFSFGGHFYFVNDPSLARRFALYLGAGVKRGSGDMKSNGLTQNYQAQSLAFPMDFGLLYRFSATDERVRHTGLGWGLGAKLSYQMSETVLVGLSEESFDRTIRPQALSFTISLSSFF